MQIVCKWVFKSTDLYTDFPLNNLLPELVIQCKQLTAFVHVTFDDASAWGDLKI